MFVTSFFRSRKSAGVRVSAPVHSLLRRGNVARDARDWKAAAEAYRRALELDPSLTHIWIQYGHMSKEVGDYSTAAFAYVSAVSLRPSDPGVLHWLYAIAGHVGIAERQRLAEMLRGPHGDERNAPPEGQEGETVFDISDLVSYFGKARLPTGIQRVQIEAVRTLIEERPAGIRLCCAIEGQGDWVEVATPLFLRLAELATLSGDREDPAWGTALNRLHVDLMLAEPMRFGRGAALVNLGTSWWLQNYFLHVRNAKSNFDIRYIPFVHDLIPIMAPEHCVDGLVKDFVSWIIGVFEHADGFLVASEATERDLRTVASRLGWSIPPGRISHVPLNADFRPRLPSVGNHAGALKKFGLDGKPYILFVSTIESRKGHTVALDAWQGMIERHGSAVPTLVCVGNDGWLNQDVYARIEATPALSRKVTFLSKISDADLATLYSQCLFTIYPSRYEGWGLPITESLCHGKAVITCDNSSLPQAGDGFATIIATGSSAALAEAVEAFCFEDGALARAEENIIRHFKPRSWREIGADIIALPRRIVTGMTTEPRYQKPVDFGLWYDLTRNEEMRIWEGAASAEMYRVGTGWSVPDQHCAWIQPGGARLAIPYGDVGGPGRLILRLVARRAADIELIADGKNVGEIAMNEDQQRWLSLPLDLTGSGICLVDIVPRLRGGEVDIAAGLAGFILCREVPSDLVAPLEAIAFDGLAEITAFRGSTFIRSTLSHRETDAA